MTPLSGMLPIFKPIGMTSKDVSRRLIKRFGKLKIGHVGTLDPDADGVLTVLIGSATKLQDYLLDMKKCYEFSLKFGTSTDTLDASGEVTGTSDFSHINTASIEKECLNFLGNIEQTPPMYSAVKYKGKELYKYARSNSEAVSDAALDNLKRPVIIYDFKLLGYQEGTARFHVECSKGTYVRTLGADLAKNLGTLAHVVELRRVLSSGVSLHECHSLETLTSAESQISDFLVPIQKISINLPIWTTNDTVLTNRILNGQHVEMEQTEFNLNLDRTNDSNFKTVGINDASGSKVGIGEISYFDNNHVIIHLKRGF